MYNYVTSDGFCNACIELRVRVSVNTSNKKSCWELEPHSRDEATEDVIVAGTRGNYCDFKKERRTSNDCEEKSCGDADDST